MIGNNLLVSVVAAARHRSRPAGAAQPLRSSLKPSIGLRGIARAFAGSDRAAQARGVMVMNTGCVENFRRFASDLAGSLTCPPEVPSP